jgi:multidrug efflux system outer membrane protein
MKSHVIPLIALVIISFGCTVGPDYIAPEPKVASWPTTGIDLDTKNSMANLNWQEYYQEPELQVLIEKALLNNLDLRQAKESVMQSFRTRDISELSHLPSFTANLDGERDSISALASSDPRIENEFDLNVGLRWEIDFWGKLRRASEGAMANLQANKANLYAAKISLIAQTSTIYYELQDVNARMALAESNIQARQHSKHIADLRHEQGVISGLDVRQAEVSLAQEKIKLPGLKRAKNTLMYQLSVIMGESPKQQIIGSRNDELVYRQKIPVGLGSELLKRRPDIIAAERNLQASNASIGVAKADYFPNILISGRFGNRTRDFDDILEDDGRSWLLDANIEMPLWDWGRTKMNVENAQSAYQVSLMQYQKVVLESFRDVATSLENYQEAFTVYDLRNALVVATKENLRIANLRYANGVVSYLDVLDAQRSHATAEQELSSAVTAKQLSMVNLYRSLGGGWQPIEQQCLQGEELVSHNGTEQEGCPIMQ